MTERRTAADTELDLDGTRIRQRLRALRTRYPGIELATKLATIHDDQIVIRATISLPDGTTVSAHAAEPTDSAGLLDTALELAEQRATTRALDLLGIGEVPASSQRVEPTPDIPRDEAATPPLVEALRKTSARKAEAASPSREAVSAPEVPVSNEPAREPEPRRPATPPRDVATPPVHEPQPTPEPRRTQAEPPAAATSTEGDVDMADYSWTDFWKWARSHDLNAKGQVEQRIGRSMEGLQPKDVRKLLFDTGVPR